MQSLSTRIRSFVAASFMGLLAALAFSQAPAAAAAVNGPSLFSKGPETFTLKDDQGATPEFHLLTGSQNKRALAMAIVSTLNADPSLQPKLPLKQELDVKVKSITFIPHPKNSDYLQVSLALEPKVGADVMLPKLIKRSDFLSGSTIEYEVPRDEKNLALFEISSSGHLKFRYDAGKDQIRINEATASLDFQAPLSSPDRESVKFSGTGDHEVTSAKGVK